MVNGIVIILIVCVASGIIWYLVRAKKRGDKCVGCPYASACHKKCSSKKSDKDKK